jgi:hypothetical protein
LVGGWVLLPFFLVITSIYVFIYYHLITFIVQHYLLPHFSFLFDRIF